jgi:hypothetical protein
MFVTITHSPKPVLDVQGVAPSSPLPWSRCSDLIEKVAFPCGLSAEFVIVANLLPMLGQVWHHTKSGCILTAQRSRLSIMRVLLLLYSRHHELSQGF